MDLALNIFNSIVLAYFLAINAVYTALLAISYHESGRHHRRLDLGGFDVVLRSPLTLPVSVLMPAYNEESTIAEAVNALRLLEYGEFEIVVVDDGSTDATLERLTQAFSLERIDRPVRLTLPCAEILAVYASRKVANLTVVAKRNGGKADALNAGIDVSRYPLFCAIDADAILEPDALLRVVKPFMERPQETVASSGIVRIANGCQVQDGRVVHIGNPRSRIALLQVVEYLRAFVSSRTAWSRIRALFVISGAFGVFKKQSVIDAGGYRTDTVGEDMDLVLRLHRLCRDRHERYRIVFIPDPVVWTEAPETLRGLHRQRNRWHRGLLECLTLNRRMIANPRYGSVGTLGITYNLVFEAVGPLLEVAGWGALLLSIAFGQASWAYIGLFFLLAVGYGVMLSIASVLLDETRNARHRSRRGLPRLLLFTIVENFGYRQLQAVWRAEATVDFLRRKRGWGEMTRKGFEAAAERPAVTAGAAAARVPEPAARQS